MSFARAFSRTAPYNDLPPLPPSQEVETKRTLKLEEIGLLQGVKVWRETIYLNARLMHLLTA